MSRDWRDQAALMHLSRLSNVAPHYQFVKQRAINSYPASIGCADDSGPYQVSCPLYSWPKGCCNGVLTLSVEAWKAWWTRGVLC
jgi:hypothetical protein